MITPEIPVEVTERNDSVIARLRGLVGGSLTAGEIYVDQVSDPDEDTTIGPERIPGPKDRLDVLGRYLDMDPTIVGLLTGQLLPQELH
ncbi:hypothetical protein HYS95_01540, partial [Candidatus Daviesbacteria bacterium]|nr:hypothetical protein [Candidatus Daviesbacteria bacterium]